MKYILYLLLMLPVMVYSNIFIDLSDQKKNYIIKELLNRHLSNINIVIPYHDRQELEDVNFTKLLEISKSQRNNVYMLVDLGLLTAEFATNNFFIFIKNKKILKKRLNEVSLQNRLGLVIDMHLIPEICHETYKQAMRKMLKKVVFINTLEYKQDHNQKFWGQLKNNSSIEELDSEILYSFYLEKQNYKNLGLLFLLPLYKKNILIRGEFFDNKYALDLIRIVSQPKLKYQAYKVSDSTVVVLTPFNILGVNLSSNMEIITFQENVKTAYQKSVRGSMPIWERSSQMLVFPDSIGVWRLK